MHNLQSVLTRTCAFSLCPGDAGVEDRIMVGNEPQLPPQQAASFHTVPAVYYILKPRMNKMTCTHGRRLIQLCDAGSRRQSVGPRLGKRGIVPARLLNLGCLCRPSVCQGGNTVVELFWQLLLAR
jgi:hypothetical protein